ncbi:hypothetical protein BDV95DRAFT_609293 [Massariosphaeria phaeospora]|uniref:F-box domain-containing protein n=1 Tax=Massariosphaeria phaeospora TaxID=100035 RepID=A0A7C8I4A3_9PLEO|nr:hypothetical protein BDV95DRAFT_609293 [Massariosphaeria phaeospora]
MHPALGLPEVVGLVLDLFDPVDEKPSLSPLYNSLFVNKLFNHEATRIMWSANFDSDRAYLLNNLARKDVARAQFYANFIRVMEIYPRNGENVTELCHLAYPRLQKVLVYEYSHIEYPPHAYADEICKHLAQPSLLHYELHEGPAITDDVLAALTQHCPKLQSLRLKSSGHDSATAEGLVYLISALHYIHSFIFQGAFAGILTSKSFQAFAQHPRLKSLALPLIEDDWLHALQELDRTGAVFPELIELRTQISCSGLELLLRYAPKLEILIIYPQVVATHSLLAVASGFVNLVELHVEFSPGSTINGTDLINLTRSCPKLVSLVVGGVGDSKPSVKNLTDDTIVEMARLLPDLTAFHLICEPRDILSWSALRALGEHCLKLERCCLSGAIDWKIAVANDAMFPSLTRLTVMHASKNTTSLEEMDGLAGKLANMMPQLRFFDGPAHSVVDHELAVRLDPLLQQRLQADGESKSY